MKYFPRNSLFIALIALLCPASGGCLFSAHNFYAGKGNNLPPKENAFQEIRYICTEEEREDLENAADDEAVVAFLNAFWEKRNPTPGAPTNEVRVEYEKRFAFVSEHLGGSHLDRGRVYLLYGPPDEIDHNMFADLDLELTRVFTSEVWIYHRASSPRGTFPTVFDDFFPGQMKFIFADLHGFGVLEQIYSTEEDEKIDARVFLK